MTTRPRTPTPTDYALLALTAAIWAGAFVGIKLAVPELGPVGVAATRAALGFCVLLPFALGMGLMAPRRSADWGVLVLLASLNVSIPFFLVSWAELTVDAGIASLLMGIGPLFAIIGAHYFNEGDRITPQRAVGVAIGFLGLVILFGADALSEVGRGALVPKLALVAASLCYVISGLLVRRLDLNAISLAVHALAIAAITLVPIALVTTSSPAELDGTVIAAILYLGFLPTGLAYLLRFHLIRTVGYATFALSINLIPVFGVLLGVVLLGEAPGLNVIAALVLVVTGLLIARGRRSA